MLYSYILFSSSSLLKILLFLSFLPHDVHFFLLHLLPIIIIHGISFVVAVIIIIVIIKCFLSLFMLLLLNYYYNNNDDDDDDDDDYYYYYYYYKLRTWLKVNMLAKKQHIRGKVALGEIFRFPLRF